MRKRAYGRAIQEFEMALKLAEQIGVSKKYILDAMSMSYRELGLKAEAEKYARLVEAENMRVPGLNSEFTARACSDECTFGNNLCFAKIKSILEIKALLPSYLSDDCSAVTGEIGAWHSLQFPKRFWVAHPLANFDLNFLTTIRILIFTPQILPVVSSRP